MKILLTGHAGFVGSNLKDSLQGQHQLILIEKDFWDGNYMKLNSLVKDCDVVIHIGAIANTIIKNEADLLYYNYTTTKKLFDSCKIYNKKIIFASSAACYGNANKPTNLYGWLKYICECYGQDLQLNLISLRYFNIYGNGEENKSHMASVAYQAYKAGKFKLFKGKPTRDFVYIDDVVSATILAITSFSGVYDVGTGKSRMFEEVLDLMRISYTYREDNPPMGYQYYTKADSKNWLPGWEPQYNLKLGLKEYKKYLDEI